MRLYKFPKWTKRIYPNAIWDFYFKLENKIYLTFDDGPNPNSTPWLIALLKKHQIKVTFFCLGENVEKHPDFYQELLNENHQVANHSMKHLNGWKTKNIDYVDAVLEAEKFIESKLFRPPYGRIKPRQLKMLQLKGFRVVFWSVMAHDFDMTLTSAQRIKKLQEAVKPGSIVVFHDAEKALPQLKNELEGLLLYWKEKGFEFETIS